MEPDAHVPARAQEPAAEETEQPLCAPGHEFTCDLSAVTGDVSLTEMYNADEVFCTGTMGEIAGITVIDGRTIGGGAIGPVTARVAKLYQEHAAANGVKLEALGG